MRKPLIAGNWKMNLNHFEAIALVQKIAFALPDKYFDKVDVTVDQGLHATQIGERRNDGDVDLVKILVGQGEGDLLHQGDGLEVVEVHLPVAGDQRFTGQGHLLVENGNTGQGLALQVLQRRATAGGDMREAVFG